MRKKVVIIGMGLIGGSISLAIRRNHGVHITGVDVNKETLEMAKAVKAIDEGETEVMRTVSDADLIIIATPVSKTVAITAQLEDLSLKSGVIISDVGSTKATVMRSAERLAKKGVHFIGGHPMAGSHKSGVTGARWDLFENAFYILAPAPNVTASAVEQLKHWLSGTNARFIELEPRVHDLLAGSVSHLPHIVAASLVHQLEELEGEHPVLGELAAGGFRDITRIASANPVMWRDILLHNKEILMPMIEKWQESMSDVRELIQAEDETGLHNFFARAKQYRDGLPSKKQGAIPAFYDLYVDVPDHPGAISDVTGILARYEISITNIRIIEAREDITGVLRLSFRSGQDREHGKKRLKEEGFATYNGE